MNRTQRWMVGTACSGALLAGLGIDPVHAQSARPFMTTADGGIAARIDGARCAELVKMTFVGRDAEVFKSGAETAARLMNNVTTVLREQCPSLVRVSSKGVVDDKILYSGIAEAATNWTIVELGAGSGSGFLSGGGGAASGAGASGPSARDLFARDAALVPPAKMLAWATSAPHLCVRHDAPKNTCAGVNRFEAQGDGAVRITANYRLDDAGSTAVLVYPAHNKSGLFCSNPAEARVSVTEGKLSPAGRTEMQALLTERIQSAGAEVCTGYRGDAPQNLMTESFGADGSTQAQRTPATLLTARPALRLDK